MIQLNQSLFKGLLHLIGYFLISLICLSSVKAQKNTPNILEQSYQTQSDSLFFSFLQKWGNEREESDIEPTLWQEKLSGLVNEVLQQELTINPRPKDQLLVLPSQIPLYLSDHSEYHVGYMLHTTPLLLATSTLDIQFEEEIDVYWQDAYLYDRIGEFLLEGTTATDRIKRWQFLKQYLPMDSVSFGYDDPDVGEWYRLCVQYNHLYSWMMLSKPFITAIIADTAMTNVLIYLNAPNGNRHVYSGKWRKERWVIERYY